ncbi:MAG: polyketide cyclase [Acidobacteria bacterium]|nr:MAG: polyketide cyclase [Acidobacteriota bacterium]
MTRADIGRSGDVRQAGCLRSSPLPSCRSSLSFSAVFVYISRIPVLEEFVVIKKILLAIAALIVLLVAAVVILAFTVRTEFNVEREITINRPKADVFYYVKHLKNQNYWGAWYKKDPGMKQEFKGQDGSPGFIASWKSDNSEVGEGEQEIKKVVEGERLDTELRFKKPFTATSGAYLTTNAAGDNQTKVKWGFNMTLPRPFNLMCLVVDMDKEAGKDFEEGLSNLKSILEQPPIVN